MRLLPLFGAHNSQHRTAGTQAACWPGRVLLGFPRHRFAPPLLLLAAGATQGLSKQGPVFLGGGPGGQVTIPGIATVPMESQPTGFTLLNKDGFTLALADHGPAISLWGGRLTLTMRCAARTRLGSFSGFLPRGGGREHCACFACAGIKRGLAAQAAGDGRRGSARIHDLPSRQPLLTPSCRGFATPLVATKGSELWLHAEGPIDPLLIQRLEPSINVALSRFASLAQQASSLDVHVGPKGAAVRLVFAGGATPTAEVGGYWCGVWGGGQSQPAPQVLQLSASQALNPVAGAYFDREFGYQLPCRAIQAHGATSPDAVAAGSRSPGHPGHNRPADCHFHGETVRAEPFPPFPCTQAIPCMAPRRQQTPAQMIVACAKQGCTVVHVEQSAPQGPPPPPHPPRPCHPPCRPQLGPSGLKAPSWPAGS